MEDLPRRVFLAGSAAEAAHPSAVAATSRQSAVDNVIGSGAARRKIPAAVGMAAGKRGTLYAGAFGTRDSSGVPVRGDSIFRIASMTKAITTVAALQLAEQGKVDLAEPVAKHLPQLAGVDVLEGFDANGKPSLRPARTPVTLHHLLTHTCGFCYSIWDEQMFRYSELKLDGSAGKPGPLMFEPGARWQYGQGVDWAGRLVEAITGATLEDYFQEKILKPLGMNGTSYILPEDKFHLLVNGYNRQPAGELKESERRMPQRPTTFNGGGGLYSTAGDYVRFLQMILNEGAGPGKVRIIKPRTAESMMKNQIGELSAGKMKSFIPATSSDVDMHPGHPQKWGYGFLINTTPYAGGRSAGSLAWAGIMNTYYWIDPKRSRCGVLLMQYYPFVDREATGLLSDFEQAVYQYL
jgi:CubicO group peptidase (beta-lactamase class C family)